MPTDLRTKFLARIWFSGCRILSDLCEGCGICSLLLAAVLASYSHRALASPPSQTNGNAAVKYLRADAALRQAYPLPPNAATQLGQALQSPLTKFDEDLVAAASQFNGGFRLESRLKDGGTALSINANSP